MCEWDEEENGPWEEGGALWPWFSFIEIKNWDRFKPPTKAKNPDWIKLHKSMLFDYEFSMMSFSAQAALPKLWLLRATSGKPLPNDPIHLGGLTGHGESIPLAELASYGFIIPSEGDKNSAQGVLEEKRREEKRIDAYSKIEYDDPDFRRFWETYPKKLSKPDAWKAWNQTKDIRPPIDELMTAVRGYRSHVEGWETKFVKYAAGWLRTRRWEDEYNEHTTRPATSERDIVKLNIALQREEKEHGSHPDWNTYYNAVQSKMVKKVDFPGWLKKREEEREKRAGGNV